VPFHFCEAPANLLTNPARDPVANIPEFKVCGCRMAPANGKKAGAGAMGRAGKSAAAKSRAAKQRAGGAKK